MSALIPAVAASVKSGFHPRDLEGSGIVLRAWFDPRDVRQYDITDGRITTYRNKVTGAAISEVSGSGPLLAHDLNGGPCLVGDGSSKHLVGTEAALLATWSANAGDQTHTLVYLMKHVTGAPFSVGNTGQAFDESSWTGTGYNRSQGGTSTWLGDQGVSGEPHALCHRYQGSGSDPKITLDSTHQTVNAQAAKLIANPNQFVMLAIGRSTLGSFFSGRLGPVLIYTGNISDAQAIQANEGLRHWYGVK